MNGTFERSERTDDGAQLIAEQAADWALRREGGGLDAGEQAEFQAWLAQPQCAETYAAVLRVLDLANDIGDSAVLDDVRAEARLAEASAARGRHTRWKTNVAAGLVGGLFVAALAAGYQWHRTSSPERTMLAEVQPAHDVVSLHQTAIGEVSTLQLPDGSEATLNTDTRLEVRFTSQERRVRLVQGQAYFDVTPDARRPFVVEAEDREVTAVGTAFDVWLSAEHFQVVLEQGVVQIERVGVYRGSDERALTVLRPGRSLIVVPGGGEQVVDADVRRHGRWRSGFVEFDNDPLGAAVAEFGRYVDQRITLEDPHIADLRLSGVFRIGDLEPFLGVIGQIFPVRVERSVSGDLALYWREAEAAERR